MASTPSFSASDDECYFRNFITVVITSPKEIPKVAVAYTSPCAVDADKIGIPFMVLDTGLTCIEMQIKCSMVHAVMDTGGVHSLPMYASVIGCTTPGSVLAHSMPHTAPTITVVRRIRFRSYGTARLLSADQCAPLLSQLGAALLIYISFSQYEAQKWVYRDRVRSPVPQEYPI